MHAMPTLSTCTHLPWPTETVTFNGSSYIATYTFQLSQAWIAPQAITYRWVLHMPVGLGFLIQIMLAPLASLCCLGIGA